jgi:hypothetical protein
MRDGMHSRDTHGCAVAVFELGKRESFTSRTTPSKDWQDVNTERWHANPRVTSP